MVNLKRYLIRATGKSMNVEFKHRGEKSILNRFQRICFNVLSKDGVLSRNKKKRIKDRDLETDCEYG